MKIIINIILLLSCAFGSTAQVLRPGDEFELWNENKFVNTEQGTGMQTFKGKTIILDFISPWCTGCVRALPGLDSIQRVIGDAGQIVLVFKEDKPTVLKFLERRKKIYPVKFPVIVEDSLLNEAFPHVTLPHDAWVNPQGRVAAITVTEFIAPANVKLVAAGEIPNWPMKQEYEGGGIVRKPLIAKDGIKESYYYSGLTAYREGSGSYSVLDIDSSIMRQRWLCVNKDIIWLYKTATGLREMFNSNRLVLDVKDSSKLIYQSGYKEEWKRKHCYSYEAVLPFGMIKERRYRKLLEDLNNYLPFIGKVEKRLTKVWVIRSLTGIDSLPYPKTGCNRPDSFPIAVTDLAGILNSFPGNPPVFNESSPTSKVRLCIPISVLKDIDSINNLLRQCGYFVMVEERLVDTLVISDR